MELVAGFILWIGDVFGVKWTRQEPNKFKKLAKLVTFLLLGVILLMLYFVITY